MKIQSYLNDMKRIIAHTSDVDLKTFKLLLKTFRDNLSDIEYTRWILDIDLLLEVNTVQLSLKTACDLAVEKGLLNNKGDKIE